jgi:hypothetical protein
MTVAAAELSRNIKPRNAALLGRQSNFANRLRLRITCGSNQLNQFLEVCRQLRYAIAPSVSGSEDARQRQEREKV